MITEDYVSFETAKLLRESGFDVETYASIKVFANHNYEVNGERITPEKDTIIPTLQMAMKWLREEKGIAVIPIISSVLDFEKFLWDVKIVVAKTGDSYSQGWVYEKQERACEVAIKYCLENLI